MKNSLDYWYGEYQASLAFARTPRAVDWEEWSSSVFGEIVAGQVGDHWEDLVGPSYATAMATLILQTTRTASAQITDSSRARQETEAKKK